MHLGVSNFSDNLALGCFLLLFFAVLRHDILLGILEGNSKINNMKIHFNYFQIQKSVMGVPDYQPTLKWVALKAQLGLGFS